MTERVLRRARHEWRAHTTGRPLTSFDRQITWLLGSPRSGSTWLQSLLASHPRIVGINEPQIGYNLTPFLADVQGFDVSELDSGNFANRRLRRDSRSEFFNDEFAERWTLDLGRLVRGRLHAEVRRYALDVPLRRIEVLVQEPNGSQSADLLLAAMPSSRVLFLVRDVRDVVDSELAAMTPGAWVSQAFPGSRGIEEGDRVAYARKAAHRWAMRSEVVAEAMDGHPGSKLLVRYEELRRDTFSTVEPIFRWMGVESHSADVRGWIERMSFERIAPESTGSKAFNRAAAPGGWKEGLSAAELEAVMSVASNAMTALGY